MLNKIFLQVLGMSFTASFVIAFVAAARLLLKKAPKIFSYVLWSAVLFRLLCPFSLESGWSLLPSDTTAISTDIARSQALQSNARITSTDNTVDSTVNPMPPVSAPDKRINPLQIGLSIGAVIWLSGITVMFLYSIVSLLRLRHNLVGAVRMYDNIYLVDHIASPFVLGLFRPRIYLPSVLSEQEMKYIILHEQTHIRRRDYIIKLIWFLALAVHWFNPLAWLAFILFNKDMEMSCDESVMKRMDTDIRCDYSASLLRLATGRKIIAGTPLTFGEGDTKDRIKNVMNYKKPAFGMIALAAALVIVICTGLIINPSKRIGKVELADIEEMNIGSQMPDLLYGDDSNVVMHGTFGLLVYNLEVFKVMNRISYDELRKLDINYAYAGVSQDGTIIYFGDDNMEGDSIFTHQYNIKSNTLKKFSGQDIAMYQPSLISPGYDEQYDKYFDRHYLISETVIDLEHSFLYLRAAADWSMKSLQLVNCQYEDGTSKVYNLFSNDSDIPALENTSDSADAIDLPPVDSISSAPAEEGSLSIKGEEEIDKFILEEGGMLRFPSGTVREVSYLLPGYKKVIVDRELFKEDIEKIFKILEKAEAKTNSTPYSPRDGAGLMIEYVHDNEVTQIELLSSYNMKTVYVRFSMEGIIYHDSDLILSEELSQIIHKISGWEAFDTTNLKEIDSMSIQVTSGVQASDLVITISGEQARNRLDKMSSSAEVIDWNNGGYNILIKMYKGKVLTYNAYLSGDSSPTIGIESQFFKINSDVIREIYKELGYDMPVS